MTNSSLIPRFWLLHQTKLAVIIERENKQGQTLRRASGRGADRHLGGKVWVVVAEAGVQGGWGEDAGGKHGLVLPPCLALPGIMLASPCCPGQCHRPGPGVSTDFPYALSSDFVAQKQPQTQGNTGTWPDLLTRPRPLGWAASGGDRSRGALEKREGLICLGCRPSKPTGPWGPGQGAASSQAPRGWKGKVQGASSGVLVTFLTPQVWQAAASGPGKPASTRHKDALERTVTHWTTGRPGNKSTASMQHKPV